MQFVKISSQHEIAGCGFAGNIFITLNGLTYLNNDDTLYVDMETYECICTENDIYLHDTNNSWEYYFDQVKINEGDEVVSNMTSLMAGNLSYHNPDVYLYPENFVELKNKFNHSFKMKPYLKEIIDGYYDENIKGKVTLGVQVRLTDMLFHHKVSKLDVYVNKINGILSENSTIEQIFLATDDWLVVYELREKLSIPILCYEDMFRADAKNRHEQPYDRLHDDRELHRYKIGVECMEEIFTLTKCDYLLKAHISSVSIVASILSENIKKIYKL